MTMTELRTTRGRHSLSGWQSIQMTVASRSASSEGMAAKWTCAIVLMLATPIARADTAKDKEIEELERLVGRMAVQLDIAKKVFGNTNYRSKESD